MRYTLPGGAAWHQTDFAEARTYDPPQFVDHYEEAVVAMLKKKQAGLPVSREYATPRPQNAVNLMEALRRSIAQKKKPHPAASVKARKWKCSRRIR